MNKFFMLVLSVAVLGMTACSGAKSAAKEEMKTIEGTWSATVAGTPAGTIPLELTFMKEGEDYKGHITANGSKTDLRSVKVMENKASASFYSSEYGADIYFTVNYSPETDTVEGYVMDEFKITGKRKMMEGN